MEKDVSHRYTEAGLPQITRGVIEVYCRDLNRREHEGVGQECAEDEANRFFATDRTLADTCLSYAIGAFGSDVERASFMTGCNFIYELLRKQGEVNLLEGFKIVKE